VHLTTVLPSTAVDFTNVYSRSGVNDLINFARLLNVMSRNPSQEYSEM
jgi:hypothetical protein